MGKDESAIGWNGRWTALAVLLGLVGGVSMTFAFALVAADDATSAAAAAAGDPAKIAAAAARATSYVAAVGFIGIVIGGLGTALRAVAHARQEGWKTVDLVGKLMAVAAFMFAVCAAMPVIDEVFLSPILTTLGWVAVTCIPALGVWHVRGEAWTLSHRRARARRVLEREERLHTAREVLSG